MIGFELPWYTFPLLVFVGAPWLALGGALAFGYAAYRTGPRARTVKVLLAALAGTQLVPLFALAVMEGARNGRTALLISVGFFVVAGLALFLILAFLRRP